MKLFYYFVITLLCILLTGCKEKRDLEDGYKYCKHCKGYGTTDFWGSKICMACFGSGQVIDFNIDIDNMGDDEEDDNDEEDDDENDNGNDNGNHGGCTYPPTVTYYDKDDDLCDPPTPEPQPCYACNGTGQCNCVRDGHPGKELSPLSIATEKPIYQTHQYCHGSGNCPACGGDGKLDYGKDY